MTNATEVKKSLAAVGPRRLVELLGLGDGAVRRGAANVMIRCPVRLERHASCSVSVGDGGLIRVRCFGCGAGMDALGLVAAARGLDTDRDFQEILSIASDLTGGASFEPSSPAPPRTFPPDAAEVWADCASVYDDEPVSAYLRSRGIDPGRVADEDAARVLTTSPVWARWDRRTWIESGHRLILPVINETGTVRSLRACRITDGETPKRLAPARHRADGLVLACPVARQVFTSGVPDWIGRLGVLVVEGEFDFLAWVTQRRHERLDELAIVGVGAGMWSEAIAARVPDGADVIVRTHRDEAGDRYAQAITNSLGERCRMVRAGGGLQ